jgi:hypothetical protein
LLRLVWGVGAGGIARAGVVAPALAVSFVGAAGHQCPVWTWGMPGVRLPFIPSPPVVGGMVCCGCGQAGVNQTLGHAIARCHRDGIV